MIQSIKTYEPPAMSFASQARPSNPSRPNTNTPRPSNRDPTRQCTVCGLTGHETSGCFIVIGYPDWWEDSKKNKNQNRNIPAKPTTPTNQNHNNMPRANTATVSSTNLSKIQANLTITDADRQGLSGITDDQWSIVQTLINNGKTNDHLKGKSVDSIWILDTGATHHMRGQLHLMEDTRDIPHVPVLLPAGAEAMALKQGTVKLTPTLHIKNVYYVAGFHTNLISFGQLVTDNFFVGQVTDNLMILQDRTSRMLIGAGEKEGEGLYRFRGIESLASVHTTVLEESLLWHRRLGHPSSHITGKVPTVPSLYSTADHLIKTCSICFRAKQTRLSFSDSFHNANEIFELIHYDLWGPYRTTALCGSRYFLTIIDDHLRAVWLFLLPDKTLVSQQIKDFLTLIERQFSKKIKTLRSDNGTEFMCLTRFFKEQGIIHENSCVHTPQQNGRAERKHRHILNVARALRFQANLPIELWGECVLAAGYLINRTPSSLLQNKTPYEKLHGQPPDITHL
ncbi:hypothetical protein YC2023_083334 [Brassica napus]